MEVRALRPFEHYGSRRRGERFHAVPRHAAEMAARGLVEIIPALPMKAAGKPSSVSPAAQVLPQTTASVSAGGAKKKRRMPRKSAEASS